MPDEGAGPSVALSDGELELLRRLAAKVGAGREVSLKEAERLTGIPASSLSSLAWLLQAKGLLDVKKIERKVLRLTPRGAEALSRGLPEESLIELLRTSGGSVSVDRARSELGELFNIAVGAAARHGFVRVQGASIVLTDEGGFAEYVGALKSALAAIARGEQPDEMLTRDLISRGLAKAERITEVRIVLTQRGAEVASKARPVITRLTHDILVSLKASGAGVGYSIKPYDVTAEPPKVLPAKKHLLAEFIEELKDVMKELGFEEVEGPIIELELFNFDALFQPQDHPAREIHDTLWPDLPPADLDEYADVVRRVREEHERGWGYSWSPSVASRYILRSQTTAVSIRQLLVHHEPPVRLFTIDKVFRADPIDATHLSDFHQLDGIIGDRSFTFRDLLGFLKEFSRRIGLDIRFKPAYFPFTEPSVEGYANVGGKMVEVFGAGLFRPEVLRIAGVDFRVGAWGMGVERLALARLGLSDVRQLYTHDIEFLRSFAVRVT